MTKFDAHASDFRWRLGAQLPFLPLIATVPIVECDDSSVCRGFDEPEQNERLSSRLRSGVRLFHGMDDH
jgi:hypothetical protein